MTKVTGNRNAVFLSLPICKVLIPYIFVCVCELLSIDFPHVVESSLFPFSPGKWVMPETSKTYGN